MAKKPTYVHEYKYSDQQRTVRPGCWVKSTDKDGFSFEGTVFNKGYGDKVTFRVGPILTCSHSKTLLEVYDPSNYTWYKVCGFETWDEYWLQINGR